MTNVNKIHALLIVYNDSASSHYKEADKKKLYPALFVFLGAMPLALINPSVVQSFLSLFLLSISVTYLIVFSKAKYKNSDDAKSLLESPFIIIMLSLVTFVVKLVFLYIVIQILDFYGLKENQIIGLFILYAPLTLISLYYFFKEYRDFKKSKNVTSDLKKIKDEIKESLNTINGMIYCKSYCDDKKLKHSHKVVKNMLNTKLKKEGFRSELEYQRNLFEKDSRIVENNNKKTISNF